MTFLSKGACGWLCALLLAAAPVSGKNLIQQGYEAGTLDLQTALLYQLQAARDLGQVPAQYREQPTHPVCGTPMVVQAMSAAQQETGPYVERLAKIMARPRAEYEQLSVSGHFRIHYDMSGSGAVDPADLDDNGIPDYVDEVERTLDEVWELQVETLGFQPPPSDGVLGGGPEYDVYITELGRGEAYGFTYPELGGKTTHSYMQLDNNYTDALYRQTRGLDALHVTVAHEFNHAIQFGYYQGSDGIWWQEATATWMEEVAYPEVDDYLQYLDDFLLYPKKSLDSGSRFGTGFRIYGASLFAHYLHQRFEPEVVRAIWEEFARWASADMSHFHRVLREYTIGGLAAAMTEFAVWNYFTGDRHRPGYYAEGQKYPEVPMLDLNLDLTRPKVPLERTESVDHLAATYLRLAPALTPGGVKLELTPDHGQWRPVLLLASVDSVQVVPLNAGIHHVPGWDRYTEVVLMLAQTEESGVAYEYDVAVTYDPELVDGPVPLALRLGPAVPNPFRVGLHESIVFQYDVDTASTNAHLSIFDAAGSLVRVFDLGDLPARSGTCSWDGTNQFGQVVGSGIYYSVLRVDGRRTGTTLAVVR